MSNVIKSNYRHGLMFYLNKKHVINVLFIFEFNKNNALNKKIKNLIIFKECL